MDSQAQSLMEQFIGHYGWIAVTFALGFFFKESIINIIQGCRFLWVMILTMMTLSILVEERPE